MEKKRPKEQIAVHNYKRQGASTQPRRRIVTLPEKVQSDINWNKMADRREQLRRSYARPNTHTRLVPRTFAQTGVPASTGQMRAIHRARARRKSMPTPARASLLRTAKKWSFIRRILAFFSVLGIVILGASFALTSSAFRVQQVNVVGTDNRVLVDTIQHMGMQGQNIFLVDAGNLNSRIDALPTVASANLGKQLPNQLTVTVVERVPVLLWQTKQGTYSVDRTGKVIALASEMAGAAHLKTVEVSNGSQAIHPGVQLNGTDISFAVEVFDRLSKVMGTTAYTLRYDPKISVDGGNGSYVVESAAGWSAYLGGVHDVNPLDNRLIELQQILALAQQQQLKLATIDMRYGLRPVYTLKS